MFTLPNLGYDYDSLGDYISKDIMQLHHDKHHQTYVDKLNAAVEGHTDLAGKEVSELLTQLDSLPEDIRTAVRNHGGGHFNHSLFWQWMSPQGGGQPGGELEKAIIEKYGDFQTFIDQFNTKALGVFGSGWVWLQSDLEIITSPNQDSPLLTGQPAPLLGLDV